MLGLFHAQIERMDSDVWKEREDAHKIVREMALKSDLCAMHLRDAARKHRSCEVRHRARRIMNVYCNSVLPFPKDITEIPCIDMIADRDVRKAAITKYIGKGFRGHFPDYSPLRHATYNYAYDKIRDGSWSKQQAQQFLRRTKDHEMEFFHTRPWLGCGCYGDNFEEREDH